MLPQEMEQGDIVQIDPLVPRMGGCLLVVDETQSWGVIGHIQGPGSEGPIFFRCPWPDMEPTKGIAAWILGSHQEIS